MNRDRDEKKLQGRREIEGFLYPTGKKIMGQREKKIKMLKLWKVHDRELLAFLHFRI